MIGELRVRGVPAVRDSLAGALVFVCALANAQMHANKPPSVRVRTPSSRRSRSVAASERYAGPGVLLRLRSWSRSCVRLLPVCSMSRRTLRAAGWVSSCSLLPRREQPQHDLSNDARDLRREHIPCVQRWRKVREQVEQDEQVPIRAEAVLVAHRFTGHVSASRSAALVSSGCTFAPALDAKITWIHRAVTATVSSS